MPNQYTRNPRHITKPCESCGKPFKTYLSAIAAGGGKFCSRACHNDSLRIPLADRFERCVERHDGCWGWMCSVDDDGYAKIGIAGSPVAAHRASWELHRGPIPDGQFVLHRCDNPSCTNPEHLFLGTHLDNMRDKTRKHRQTRGESSHLSKLTEADVLMIRARYATGTVKQYQLAAEYGVDKTTISCLLRGVTWKHLLDPPID